MNIQELNQRFALAGQLLFRTGPGGLPLVEIFNDQASASICLMGGHVMSWQPREHAPVLWMSGHSNYQIGKAIRGGIPICWPWFGANAKSPEFPAHGIARTALWRVLSTASIEKGVTQLRLGLNQTDAGFSGWPHNFDLELAVTVGQSLQVTLGIRNSGSDSFTWTGALHSYFSVGHITEVTVEGLQGLPYTDRLDPIIPKSEDHSIHITAETDRIYTATEQACRIVDRSLGRNIHVEKSGSRSTVVWNPWVNKAAAMADFGNEEYPGMICIEAANAADDAVTLEPGDEHKLTQIIRVD